MIISAHHNHYHHRHLYPSLSQWHHQNRHHCLVDHGRMASMVVLNNWSSFFYWIIIVGTVFLSAHRIIVRYSSVADPDWIRIKKITYYNF
jgi:hypothetical protein